MTELLPKNSNESSAIDLAKLEQESKAAITSASEELNKSNKKLRFITVVTLTPLGLILLLITIFLAYPKLLEPILGSVQKAVISQISEEFKPPKTHSTQTSSQTQDSENLFIQAEAGEIAIGGRFNHLKVYHTANNNFAQLPVNLSKTEFPKGLETSDSLVFSKDGKLLFFSFNEKYIAIYDFKSEKIINASEIDVNPTIYSTAFSPDGNYFIIDTESDSGDRGRHIMGIDGHEYGAFSGQTYLWNPESTGLVLETQEVELVILPTEPVPTTNSLLLIYPSAARTVQTTLLRANYQISYSPITWKDNDNLIYKQIKYPKPFPDEPTAAQRQDPEYYEPYVKYFNNPDETYWQINIITKVKTELAGLADYPEKTMQTDQVSYSSTGDWKTWSADGAVFISKSNGIKEYEISKGNSSAWNPVPPQSEAANN